MNTKKINLKKMLMALSMGIISLTINAQSSDTEITSIKPKDATPVFFSTQEELDSKKVEKIEKIKDQIKQNIGNDEKTLYLRQELWRFENAVVSTPKKNN